MSEVMTLKSSEEETLGKKHDDGHDIPASNGNRFGNNKLCPTIPHGCRPLAHQVAGHRCGEGRLGIGMLQYVDGSILKPVQPPPRGEREMNFYKKIFNSSCKDSVLLSLRSFLPNFLGTWTPPVSSDGNNDTPTYSYLRLQDASRRFNNPSVLDVKIGRVSHDPYADEKKKSVMSAQYPPLADVGFQLLGMRISGPSSHEALFYGKEYGRSLTKDRISEGLDLYLSGNIAWKKNIAKAFLHRLEMILAWFESQRRYQFYSSSLLLIYEGELLDGSSDSDEEFIHNRANVKASFKNKNNYSANVPNFLHQNHSEGKNETISDQSLSPRIVISEPSNRHLAISKTSAGQESGYSSEVESKSSTEPSKDKVEIELVKSLYQRVEVASTDANYHKHQFSSDMVDVRMIDFTHVFEEHKSDDNYMFGLRNLIACFRRMLKTL